MVLLLFFFSKQKTAYEMRISDWSSDVCSSDLTKLIIRFALVAEQPNSRDEERLSAHSSENSIAGIKRYTGFVRGRDLYPLFDHVSLEANPRAAKTGAVTSAILASLDRTPELFPFKSKGIFLGQSTYESLKPDRKSAVKGRGV